MGSLPSQVHGGIFFHTMNQPLHALEEVGQRIRMEIFFCATLSCHMKKDCWAHSGSVGLFSLSSGLRRRGLCDNKRGFVSVK